MYTGVLLRIRILQCFEIMVSRCIIIIVGSIFFIVAMNVARTDICCSETIISYIEIRLSLGI